MAIKQSTLEKKWHYRVAKVISMVIPPALIILLVSGGFIDLSGISHDNILAVMQKNMDNLIFLAIMLILYFVVLNVVWRVFLYIVFGGLENDVNIKSKNMAQAGNASATPSPNESKLNETGPLVALMIIFIIIFLAQSGYIKLPKIYLDSIGQDHTYGASCAANGKAGLYGTDGKCYTCPSGSISIKKLDKNCSNGTAGIYCCTGFDDVDSGCIKTGCEHMWYCSGRYYIGGQEITVPGLCYPTEARNIYPSWSGICRKCP